MESAKVTLQIRYSLPPDISQDLTEETGEYSFCLWRNNFRTLVKDHSLIHNLV